MYKKIFEGKKAVFFELEGAVTKDTGGVKTQAFRKTLEPLHLEYIDPDPYCKNGYTFEEIWKSLISANRLENRKLNIKELTEKTQVAYLEIINNPDFKMEPLDGFWELCYELKEEKNYKLGLLTNLPQEIEEAVVKKLDIGNVFDIILCKNDVKKVKHSPEIYKKALKKLKIKASEALAFESSIPGVQAAEKAKIGILLIWDEKTRKSFFEDKYLAFSRDFTPYPGSLDETEEEYLAKSIREAVEDKKKNQNNAPLI